MRYFNTFWANKEYLGTDFGSYCMLSPLNGSTMERSDTPTKSTFCVTDLFSLFWLSLFY